MHSGKTVVACPRSGEVQRGFTLVELMIVVAIVGILASLAIPTYQGYATRARVSEGLALIGPVKMAVAEHLAINGGLPVVKNNEWTAVLEKLGLPSGKDNGAASSEHVKRIWWYNNSDAPAIKIRYAGGAAIDDKILLVKAHINDHAITWECEPAAGGDGVPEEYLPTSCKS